MSISPLKSESHPRYWVKAHGRFVKATSFRYITDAITKEEALELLKRNEAGKKAREEEVIKRGYPAYTTSVGWLGKPIQVLSMSELTVGYTDEKVRRLTLESLNQGFNHFKVSGTIFHESEADDQLKVGADPEDDLRRGLLIRSIIDDPKNLPAGRTIDPATIEGKNAGPAGCVLMVDANRKFSRGSRYGLIPRGLGRPTSCRVHEEARTPQAMVHRGANCTR